MPTGFDIFRFQVVPWESLLGEVREFEALGARTFWLGDHYFWPPKPDFEVLEPWATLAALASATERIRLGTAASDVSLRNPAMLAKQIATVDCISGGRVEAALAAGSFERELESIGVPFLTPRGRADRLREGFEVVDSLLRERRLTYDGAYFHLDDAQLVPSPVQAPRPPLYVAANGRRGLRVAAERGDGSLSLGDEGASAEDAISALRERNALLDEYCTDSGRNPGSLERLYFTGWAEEKPFASPHAFDDFVGRYREAGVTRFIFIFTRNESGGGTVTPEKLEAFAAEKLAAL